MKQKKAKLKNYSFDCVQTIKKNIPIRNFEGNPFFSILIPSYHQRKEYLIECIQSVSRQNYSNFELIICEQGDDDLSWLRNFFKDIRIIHQDVPSLYKARINLLKASRGIFVLFLDSDDLLSVHCLSLLKKKIEFYGKSSFSTVFCYRSQKFKDANDLNFNQCHEEDLIIDSKAFLDMIIKNCGDITSISMKCFPRLTFKWYCDHDFFQGEDKSLCMQLATQVSQAILLYDKLYFYRINPESGQANLSIQNISDLAIFFFTSLQFDLTDDQKGSLLARWPKSCLSRCILGLSNGKIPYKSVKEFIQSDLNCRLVDYCVSLKKNILRSYKGFRMRIIFFLYIHKSSFLCLVCSKFRKWFL